MTLLDELNRNGGFSREAQVKFIAVHHIRILSLHPARVITRAQLRVRRPPSLRDALDALGQQAGERTLGCRR